MNFFVSLVTARKLNVWPTSLSLYVPTGMSRCSSYLSIVSLFNFDVLRFKSFFHVLSIDHGQIQKKKKGKKKNLEKTHKRKKQRKKRRRQTQKNSEKTKKRKNKERRLRGVCKLLLWPSPPPLSRPVSLPPRYRSVVCTPVAPFR